MTNSFLITIPFYNSKWVKECLESILAQKYPYWKAVVVDDASNDGSGDNAANFCKRDPRFIYTRNSTNLGSPIGNITTAIDYGNEDDIIVNVDGDDWLSNEAVLLYLNEIYQNNDIWVTYGQFEPLSREYSNYCQPLQDSRNYRHGHAWVTSHLRTFRRKLFKKINENDLKDTQGHFYKAAGDLALMYPLLEMAGLKHSRFIDKVLYIYNDTNEMSEMRKFKNVQLELAEEIRRKPVYPELSEL